MAVSVAGRKWSEVFVKHPAITVVAALAIIILTIDVGLGTLLLPKAIGVQHAYYHHGFPKNLNVVRDWGGRTYRFYTNWLGLVDESDKEFPLSSEKHRIVVLGDSFTEGLGVEFNKSFVGRLKQQADKYDIEIYNGAVTSYSPKLYYLKAKYLIEKRNFKFDEIVVFVDISDIQDELLYECFQSHDGILQSKQQIINEVSSFLKQHSLVYFYANNVLHGKEGMPVECNAELLGDNWFDERSRWTIEEEIFTRWGMRGLDLAAYQIKALKNLCDKHGIKLSLAVYPWYTQIHSGDNNSIQELFWGDFCITNNIDFIDLFPVFFNGDDPEHFYAKYFIPGDDHWNENGHRLVADALIRHYEKSWIRNAGSPAKQKE